MADFPNVLSGKLYIHGRWRDAAAGLTSTVSDPATEKVIGTIALATTEDLDETLASSEEGLNTWRAVDAWSRSAILRKIATILREWSLDAARLMTLEQGKPLKESISEWHATADQFDWYADEARRVYGRTVPGHSTANRIIVNREPVGVVATFSAWNFPALLPSRKIAPALAAGCSVIVRPPEEAPYSTQIIVKAAEAAGLPPGALNMVTGQASKISEHLLESNIVRKLSLTGSVPVGQTLMHLAADHITDVSMELGGHAPVLIFPDADIKASAQACVTTKYRNAGQVCASPTRFIVHESVVEEFTKEFVSATIALRVGHGNDENTEVGPLTNQKRIEEAEALIADAVKEGAILAAGGQRDRRFEKGHFFQPTVLTQVPPQARIMHHEPFAPIAPITTFATLEEALEIANATDFGLASYVWTTDLSTAFLASEGIEAGMVGVNNMAVATAEAPFGGVKYSGFGREGGAEGVLDYTVTKTTFISLEGC